MISQHPKVSAGSECDSYHYMRFFTYQLACNVNKKNKIKANLISLFMY